MLAFAAKKLSIRAILPRCSIQPSKRRFYATFEESPSDKEVPTQFVPPPQSKGDSQTLPLVQKARSLLESRKSGTFTSVSLKGEDVRCFRSHSVNISPIGRLAQVLTQMRIVNFRKACHCLDL